MHRLHPLTRTLALLLALALLPALQGCITMPKGLLTNRVTVTVALDECQTASRWGGISIGSDIDQRDCEAILQAAQLRALMLAAKAAQAEQAAPARQPTGPAHPTRSTQVAQP